MDDEKNTQRTEKIDELFTAETDATTEGAPAPDAPTTPTTATTATTTVVPEAEPAWLRGADHPVRTTPRVRWAAIIWGLVFVAAGWFTVWTLLAEDRRAAFSDWILSLDNGGWAVVGALCLGALLLVIGLSQALKAATRQRAQ
jgi:hypothetical protein